MPMTVGAMGMKLIATRILGSFGYRQVLIVNTLMIGISVTLFSFVVSGTPVIAIVILSPIQGFSNFLQFTSMNSMAYADIDEQDTSMASTMVKICYRRCGKPTSLQANQRVLRLRPRSSICGL